MGELNGRRLELRADCANCSGLCCVALTFARSADFAIDKAAGEPCPNLQRDFRCGIHTRLRPAGFKGCTVFDCFGAGQQVTQVTYSGQDWRQAPDTAEQMFAVFAVMRQLHEMLWYLRQGMELVEPGGLHAELAAAYESTESLTRAAAVAVLQVDLTALRVTINILLSRTSALVRSPTVAGAVAAGKAVRRRRGGRLRPGADLIGADLRRADLTGADLRGALLIAANLSQTDLSFTDLIGTDLRDADLRGANLTESLFLTQAQLNSAKGDQSTRIPATLDRPAHWKAADYPP